MKDLWWVFRRALPWVVVFLIFMAAIVWIGISDKERWAADCQRDGGHVVDLHKGTLCVDSQGRIIRGR